MISRISSWSAFFLVFSLFALPISSTARGVFVALALFFFVLDAESRADLLHVLKRPWVLAAFALFVLTLLGCFWSPASWHAKWLVLQKYTKLLYLPFFVVGFRDKRVRYAAAHAFLLAMLITSVLLIVKAMGFIHYGGVDPGKLFRNHIMTGYMLAFSAYLTAYFALKTKGFYRVLYGLSTVLFSYTVLFICTGRMAYLAYTMVMLIWFFQCFSWRKALLWGAGFLLCFWVSYQINPTMQFLVHQVEEDWTSYHHEHKNTSLGLRLQFHTYAYDLFKYHSWIGNGTGGFSHLFERDTPVSNWKQLTVWEPHSQYWLIAADYGVLGLLLYFIFLGTLLVESWQLFEMRGVAFATLLPFMIGSLTDSLLLYSGTGYFFFLFIALSFGTVKSSNRTYNQADVEDERAHPVSLTKAGEIQT
ncbi:MAG: O-antigen ligase family protein [Legionellaceae bacterium]|nr:O-antigen ligase family protein [Legionellaceae bacterium]